MFSHHRRDPSKQHDSHEGQDPITPSSPGPCQTASLAAPCTRIKCPLHLTTASPDHPGASTRTPLSPARDTAMTLPSGAEAPAGCACGRQRSPANPRAAPRLALRWHSSPCHSPGRSCVNGSGAEPPAGAAAAAAGCAEPRDGHCRRHRGGRGGRPCGHFPAVPLPYPGLAGAAWAPELARAALPSHRPPVSPRRPAGNSGGGRGEGGEGGAGPRPLTCRGKVAALLPT